MAWVNSPTSSIFGYNGGIIISRLCEYPYAKAPNEKPIPILSLRL